MKTTEIITELLNGSTQRCLDGTIMIIAADRLNTLFQENNTLKEKLEKANDSKRKMLTQIEAAVNLQWEDMSK